MEESVTPDSRAAGRSGAANDNAAVDSHAAESRATTNNNAALHGRVAGQGRGNESAKTDSSAARGWGDKSATPKRRTDEGSVSMEKTDVSLGEVQG